MKIYRGAGPGTLIVIFISLVLAWLQALINPVEPPRFFTENPAPLYSLLVTLFEGKPLAGLFFSMGLVLLTATYLVNFNTRLFFINERTFLPASLYVILSAYITGNQVLNPVLPASLLLLLSVDRLTLSYRKKGLAYNLYDASLIIGVAALFYTNMIWYYLLIVIGISLFRSLNARELLISLAGLITPFVLLYSFYYLTGRDVGGLNDLLIKSTFSDVAEFQFSPEFIIVSSVNLIIFLVALLHLWSVFNTKKVRSRKIFSLLAWMVLITVLIYLLVPSASVALMYVFLIPLVYILTHYLVMMRNKKIANYLFAIIFLSVVFLQISRAIII